jgi:hypothetical protein
VAPPRQSAFSLQALKSNYCAAERKTEPNEFNWCKPTMNSYKLNVDACFFPNGTGAVCTIIRDGRGVQLLARALYFISWPLSCYPL